MIADVYRASHPGWRAHRADFSRSPNMFGPLGVPELLFLFVLALLIFGPKQLPQIGRALGRGMSELRKASNDLRRTINAEMIEQELRDSDPRKLVRDSLNDVKKNLQDAVVEPQSAPADPPAEAPAEPGTVARGAADPVPGAGDRLS